METNKINAQAISAQTQIISPETTNSATIKPAATSARQSFAPLYNPCEAEQIVRHLTADGLFDPEYILLFGSLAGGTPHSDATAYDILIVTRQTPPHDWLQAKRQLRYKMPVPRREITYINIYVMTAAYVKANSTPFLYFAHNEGTLLYSRPNANFRRPKHPCDFAAALADAKQHHDTFHALGAQLLALAKTYAGTHANTNVTTQTKTNNQINPHQHPQTSTTPYTLPQTSSENPSANTRLAASFAAQAAVCFYRTLYYTYHNHEFTPQDPLLLHQRTRTLSTELMLELDDTHTIYNTTLPKLTNFIRNALQKPDFDIDPRELTQHINRVEKIQKIINRKCHERFEMYERLSI